MAKRPAKKTTVKKRARSAVPAKQAVNVTSLAAPKKAAVRKIEVTKVVRAWRPEARAAFVTQVAGGTRKAADLLEVSPSQPSRWMSGQSVPGPMQARMLVDLDHVMAHLLLVWDDEAVARDWLTTPNAHLDGVRPVDWIRLHGTSEVIDAIRSEASGAYA